MRRIKRTSMESDEVVCRICMEVPTDDNYFMEFHQCTRCLPSDYVICFVCHGTVVTRLCPRCHADYAPIVLHEMPGPPFREVWGRTMMNDNDKASLLYKAGITRGIISGSNTAAFIPFENTINFSIAQDFDQETQELSFLTVTVPMQNLANNLRGETFVFNNDVWTAIDEASTTVANQDNDVYKTPGEAVFWQFSNLTYEGSKLYTMFSSEKWSEIMDPANIVSSVSAIRERIISQRP
mmetsp:Transcript_23909/g.32750  ORF Transcript_23909/g.32750 Transcript_23909/m.32750 type:complete len:238 (-) Transcript_23909:1640-2353(-)